MSVDAAYFDQLFEASEDPWAFRKRWYEQRKRALTLACLPRQRYQRAFEPGCANGELSLALAGRCDELVVTDFSEKAVALAKARLAEYPGAQAIQGALPQDWPMGAFDLVVLSEVGYYLDTQAWSDVIRQCLACLAQNGTVLACHWLHPIEDGPQQGHEVHAQLQRELGLHRVVRHEEADFLMEVWCREPRTVDLDEPVVNSPAT